MIKTKEKNISIFPSTRFLGSKVKLLPWILDNLSGLKFNTVLDAFGGTSSFSYAMKIQGKRVYYNDILRFNQIIAKAIIENDSEIVDKNLSLEVMKKKPNKKYKNIIQNNFFGMYFKPHEDIWLDVVIQNILDVKNEYKKAILLSSLFQACLIKRPFNLFHRNNLKIRTRDVERKFGNKTTWETSFRKHFLKFIAEHNRAIFDNNKSHKVLGGYDVLKIPVTRKFDLVYLDPPYLSKKSKINYLDCYHFLEGLSSYYNWEKRIDKKSFTKKWSSNKEIEKWLDKEKIISLFEKMIKRYKDSIIVLSYRDDGIPSKKKIIEIFKKYRGKKPIIKEKPYKYALSNGSTKEMLFISKP